MIHRNKANDNSNANGKLHADYDNIFNDEIEEDIEERSPIWDRQLNDTPSSWLVQNIIKTKCNKIHEL